MSNQHNISIKINLAGITDRIQRILRRTMGLVAIGLNARDDISVKTLEMPDVAMHHQFASSTPISLGDAKKDWELWILQNGFRDIAEELSTLLEEIQKVLAYWKIGVLQKSRAVHSEDWNEIIVHRGQQFHRRTLPQKLEFLEQKYAFTLDPTLVRQALTINAARNCLVHRNGIITNVDVDESGRFTLEWSSLILLARIDGQEKVITLPYHAIAGTEILLAPSEKSKSFEIGQFFSVNTEEFTQICWTLYKLAASCAQRLETYGREQGLNIRENK